LNDVQQCLKVYSPQNRIHLGMLFQSTLENKVKELLVFIYKLVL
jgi:hypothetical protein